jgi:hypothetical protein
MSSKHESFDKHTDRPKSSHKIDGKYAILQEFSDTECESWLYFIRYDGNEENLDYLNKQLQSIEWYLIEDCSTFDLDLKNLVSATTAKEMTKVDLNSYQWHRKFDGKLQKIKFKFKPKHDNEDKMYAVYKKIGDGKIDTYIDDEDIDTEDLTDNSSYVSKRTEDTDSDLDDDI